MQTGEFVAVIADELFVVEEGGEGAMVGVVECCGLLR